MRAKMLCRIIVLFVSVATVRGFAVRDITENGNFLIDFEYHPNVSGGKKPRATNDGSRPGNATDTHSCGTIGEVPAELRSATNMYPDGLGEFYQKYTEAYGIPVLGSSYLPDDALYRACYIVRFLLADRYQVRNYYYRNYGRFAIMSKDEVTTDIPEHASLGSYWDTRARGLGASLSNPVSTGAEENVLCYDSDPYYNEDIALHEFSHGAHILGARYAIPDFDSRLEALYNSAQETGLWNNTYAMSTVREYFAEGVQSFFNSNAYSDPPNGIHNNISTREALKSYDPELHAFIEEFFPCNNTYIHRCDNDRDAEINQELRINCAEDDHADCTDNNRNCPNWATTGECESNPDYMLKNCQYSCDAC